MTHIFKLLTFCAVLLAVTGCISVSSETAFAQKQKNRSTKKAQEAPKTWPENIQALVGSGAVLVVDHHAPLEERELFALNAEEPYVPASILKIVTSGAALETLGPDFRFPTDFYLTEDKDLWIVGYGDPYLVSEELALLCGELQKKGLPNLRNILLDISYFEPDLILDGNSGTQQPYDAFNGALGVNFNTVLFRRDKKGRIKPPDDDTPLTQVTLDLAARTKRKGERRLNISDAPSQAVLHAGQMFKAYLERAGVKVTGEIRVSADRPEKLPLFHRHLSSLTLEEMIRELLKYSNNYITNQIFLTMGAEIYGAPATAEKARRVLEDYLHKHAVPYFPVGDGSGLSRQTLVSARQMALILEIFEPDRYLISGHGDDGQVLAKTGTMSDIQTLAGYLERPEEPDRPLSFVILLNGTYEYGARDQALEMIIDQFIKPEAASAGR